MLETIITATGVYISTSIDYLVILVLLFGQLKTNRQLWHIYAGHYLGTAILVAVSLFITYVLQFVPEDWMIGLLGLIPIYLGIRFILVSEEEEEEEVLEMLEKNSSHQFFWVVTLITIASGGDNLGIYVPYFSSLDWGQIVFVLIIFALGVFVLCKISQRLSSLSFVSETIEEYEQVIVPLVFIPLGFYIMWENGTIQTILGFIL